MKALSFEYDEVATYGLAVNGAVYPVEAGFRAQYKDLRAVLAAGALDSLGGQCSSKALDPAKIRYLPTIPNPDKIICVGVNYRAHAEEMGRDFPDKPLLFVRFAGSVVGHEQALSYPDPSSAFDFEGELALIIGKRASRVSRADAGRHIAGYCCFMDGSARDWQRHTSQFTAGKNFRASGAMGPYLVTPDEAGEVSGLTIRTHVNGSEMQNAPLNDLIFDIPSLIEYCSTFTDLLPGDVIATGTPSGVAAGRKPPNWLQRGDEVTVDIGSVGRLHNRIAAD